jgi:hypothetical protein
MNRLPTDDGPGIVLFRVRQECSGKIAACEFLVDRIQRDGNASDLRRALRGDGHLVCDCHRRGAFMVSMGAVSEEVYDITALLGCTSGEYKVQVTERGHWL